MLFRKKELIARSRCISCILKFSKTDRQMCAIHYTPPPFSTFHPTDFPLPVPPAGGAEIISGPRNQTRKATEQVVLQCHTRARPDNVTVQWLRDGADVTRLAELRGRLKLADNGSLVLSGLQPEDQGRYTCQASNGIGTAQRASAFLQIHCEYCDRFTEYRSVMWVVYLYTLIVCVAEVSL